METIPNLLNHRSIRKFKNQPIPSEVMNDLLEAGIRGSNTGNMQVYSIIVTQDQSLKEKMAKMHFNQTAAVESSAIITVCADVNRFHKWCKINQAEKSYNNFLWFISGAVDATIVSQNICVAAEDQGLGICYLGSVTYMAKPISELLALPKGVVPVTAIAIGYPAETPPLASRLAMDAVVHFETYNDYSDERICDIYRELENSPEMKQLVEENQMPNLANVFTQKRYTKKDNQNISKSFLDFLGEQDFKEA